MEVGKTESKSAGRRGRRERMTELGTRQQDREAYKARERETVKDKDREMERKLGRKKRRSTRDGQTDRQRE